MPLGLSTNLQSRPYGAHTSQIVEGWEALVSLIKFCASTNPMTEKGLIRVPKRNEVRQSYVILCRPIQLPNAVCRAPTSWPNHWQALKLIFSNYFWTINLLLCYSGRIGPRCRRMLEKPWLFSALRSNIIYLCKSWLLAFRWLPTAGIGFWTSRILHGIFAVICRPHKFMPAKHARITYRCCFSWKTSTTCVTWCLPTCYGKLSSTFYSI